MSTTSKPGVPGAKRTRRKGPRAATTELPAGMCQFAVLVASGWTKPAASEKVWKSRSLGYHYIKKHGDLWEFLFDETSEALKTLGDGLAKGGHGKGPAQATERRMIQALMLLKTGRARDFSHASRQLGLKDYVIKEDFRRHAATGEELRKDMEVLDHRGPDNGGLSEVTQKDIREALGWVARGYSMRKGSQKVGRNPNFLSEQSLRHPGFCKKECKRLGLKYDAGARKPKYNGPPAARRERMDEAAPWVATGMSVAAASVALGCQKTTLQKDVSLWPHYWEAKLEEWRERLNIPERCRVVRHGLGFRKRKSGAGFVQKTGGRIPSVILRESRDQVVVRGKEKPPLTRARYDVVKALLNAGPTGLTKDQLEEESGHTDARKILYRLCEKDDDWRGAIVLPGTTGQHYRISD